MLPPLIAHLPADRERMGLRPVQMAGRLGLTHRVPGARSRRAEHLIRPVPADYGALWVASVDDLSPELRKDLLRYLFATSAERARIIGELSERNPDMADLLMDLEADDDQRVTLEMTLLTPDWSGR